MAGHHEKQPSVKGWEIARNASVGWAGLALAFGWPLTLPVLLSLAAASEVEAIKKWGGIRKKLKTIFTAGGHGHAHGH